MRSMTGFAQGRFSLERLSIGITIKSLNHRFLDINFKGSGTSQEIEKMVKDIIKDDLHRGKVEIAIDLFNLDQNNWDIQFNDYLLSNILDKILHFKKKYKSELSLSLDSLLKIPMIFHLEQTGGELTDKERSVIEKKIKKLFREFIRSREEEGQEIAGSIVSSLDVLDENVKIVQKKTADIEVELFSKYKERMKKYLSEIEIDEKRIVQEAAILAEKSCVTEEVNRLKTHSTRIRNIMKKRKNDLLGKELDFLTQELLREISTISAKTNSMDVNENVILIRREIEKIKQQVQNVE
ncbi:MAG: YicC/YloC family endoribonuclease [Acidobacteriota bacterium]